MVKYVIKRNGEKVDFKQEKISIAIEKANKDVSVTNRISSVNARKIVKEIAELPQEELSVEDIQDLVELKLMEHKYHQLAKAYIVYRYVRSEVRAKNTTDDAILSLLAHKNKEAMEENSNKNAMIASTQRDLIAGEVSRDFSCTITKRNRGSS